VANSRVPRQQNELSAPFNRLNLLNQMTAAEFKKKWSRYQDKEFSA